MNNTEIKSLEYTYLSRVEIVGLKSMGISQVALYGLCQFMFP